ncbi:xanthine dehydrogenase family protein molybdopterin-binding subunit [Longimicrobium terrae]|uniref:CO/xanthine dehydrogenase Mo-binding subunit n=1 Tax=Longimicrobium terrae TaxID=1639882 RepID=A0A841H2P5_9BACT|nr:xanthine dehydrogenase family protein molybdopterin-binding subunit [Longimicrobium terrae]MBB4637991.1 CO/xanthine dehydrogenase Mo-binding subunit [Longimicrobium terrae]MBB6072238.1 CO/xanthine dehydrogenase Mo-binding subunit [Longimicrobium terrae]NNC28341.1 xanthine dehydrogenase family protein [Longimicrobium terrae]
MIPAVGRSVSRKDGMAKTTGVAKYIDDLHFPGMLYGRTIRSTIPRGRVTAIHLDFDPAGFTVVDYRDIPGPRCNFVALLEDDQPFLVKDEINHVAEAILLLAHEDRETLAGATVRLEYETDTPVLDPEQSPTVFKHVRITKGDVDSAFSQADVIVEGTYTTGHQEHVYIETNGVIAVPQQNGMTIYGSMQCPYYVHKAVKHLLQIPDDRVRVVQVETGGGFGGKEEYPNILAGHASLLARKSGRPVKMVYERSEDMEATTKRHPSIIRHRTGVKRDGTLVAMEIDVLMDGGAYVTLSPVVLSRGCIHGAGPYRCENTRIRGRVVMTNTPPNGAFRGFGAPQTQFATEVHMDRIADALGMDPVHLREINALRPGDTSATGQIMGDDCSALESLRAGVERSDYHRKRAEYAGTNRGIGLSLFFHGSGFTGGGEVYLASKATLEATETGARIRVASVEMGQGTRTMHAQIVADALGIPYEDVEIVQPDTSQVPDSGPTVASRTCMVVGRILQRCAEEMREVLGDRTPGEYVRDHGPLSITRQFQKPEEISWNDTEYTGDAYAAYGWGCDVAEVEVDPVTYEVRPLRMTIVHEVGKAIHPSMVVGQIEGGTAQGIGWALNEHVVMRDGRMANPTLTNYTIPTTLDTPPMEVVVLENPSGYGPYGAKGVGEMPMDGPAPALVNAIRHVGLDVRSIPAVPETIMEVACASR